MQVTSASKLSSFSVISRMMIRLPECPLTPEVNRQAKGNKMRPSSHETHDVSRSGLEQPVQGESQHSDTSDARHSQSLWKNFLQKNK